MATDPWPTIHDERRALGKDLASLTDAQWQTRSLCDEWTVRQVLAHMTATAELTVGGFFGGLVGSGFSFPRMQDRAIAKETEGSSADTLRHIDAIADSSKHPPGPVDSWLGETLVHAEDIRRPLGIEHSYPSDALARTIEFYLKSNMIVGGKKRGAGLALRATDADWAKGEGPEVAGPLASLMLAVAGRRAALADLSGPGVATLVARA
jgi:uncharacterized protein (TIGR03083 family)